MPTSKPGPISMGLVTRGRITPRACHSCRALPGKELTVNLGNHRALRGLRQAMGEGPWETNHIQALRSLDVIQDFLGRLEPQDRLSPDLTYQVRNHLDSVLDAVIPHPDRVQIGNRLGFQVVASIHDLGRAIALPKFIQTLQAGGGLQEAIYEASIELASAIYGPEEGLEVVNTISV